nr:ALPV-325 [Albatrosspox virus]
MISLISIIQRIYSFYKIRIRIYVKKSILWSR